MPIRPESRTRPGTQDPIEEVLLESDFANIAPIPSVAHAPCSRENYGCESS
jgi:hypothetical protein